MPAKPRLLVLTPDFPPARGGIQVLSHRLATGMPGFETRVVAADSPGADEFDAAGELTVRRVKADRRLGGGRNIPLNGFAVAEAVRFRPQATLSVHIVTSPAAAVIRRTLGAPIVQYFHAKEVGAKPRLAKFAAESASTAIAVSTYTAELIGATGASPDIRLIPPGVDLAEQTEPIPTERPTLLTIARLEDRYKGHDVIVRSLPLIRAAVPDVQWVVIGDGPLRGGLESLAAANGVADAVRFLGAVSDEERNGWLRRAQALAMPSRLPDGDFAGEGFGIAYLEAGIYGKPVIAGNVGGALDSVADGESGLLVDPTDHFAVAAAATKLLTDPELARRLGNQAAERARGFAWPQIGGRVEALLHEEIANRRGGP
jgi:phosphatidylinositol alpha-1,6-mannosyltransferase